MTNELKTLKDLNAQERDTYDRELSVSLKDLKQEAIKWIKQWRDLRFLNKIPSPKLPLSLKEQADEIIMSFFNITEEDLK